MISTDDCERGSCFFRPTLLFDPYYLFSFSCITHSALRLMFTHHIVVNTTDDRYAAASDACGWSTFYTDCKRDYTHPTPECEAATRKASQYIPSPIDPFDVLAPACIDHGDGADEAVAQLAPGLAHLGTKVTLC